MLQKLMAFKQGKLATGFISGKILRMREKKTEKTTEV